MCDSQNPTSKPAHNATMVANHSYNNTFYHKIVMNNSYNHSFYLPQHSHSVSPGWTFPGVVSWWACGCACEQHCAVTWSPRGTSAVAHIWFLGKNVMHINIYIIYICIHNWHYMITTVKPFVKMQSSTHPSKLRSDLKKLNPMFSIVPKPL